MLRASLATALALCLGAAMPEDESVDPLAGGQLDNHIAGPRLEEGSLVGKVVLLEYFGYY